MLRFGIKTCGWTSAAIASFALLTSGCSGGSGEPLTPQGSVPTDCATGNTADCGTVLVALTDADGDFISYTVDVLSLELERIGGGLVEVLPAATRVDFAQLTELSDLLGVATLPPGDYVRGTIRLDYTNAEIFVEAGGEIVPARVVDASGQALGATELEIRFDDRSHLLVTRVRAAFLSLDFDLAASHDVDVSETPAVVRARPYIVAEIAPVREKELRVRGPLVGVDLAASSYRIELRPWHRRDGSHGRATVHTTSLTAFEIDGSSYTGEAGLNALAQKPAGTLTVAFGSLDLANREFTAQIVHAGESVSGAGIDAVHGNVVARNGDRLTVKGAFAVRDDRDARFHRTVIVEVGPDTKVIKTGVTDRVFDDDAISVGQHIVAFGELEEPAASDVVPVLDATQSRVRMLVTHLHGSVAGVVPGQLNLRLRAIDRLGIEMFDFAGTGTTAAVDADPLDYEIATGSLALTALDVDTPAKVLGFVTPFGAAPPDFEARTVIDHRNLPAALGIGWGTSGTTAPFLSSGPEGFVLNLANPSVGARHHLLLGRRMIDLFDLSAAPTVAPATGRALFGLAAGGDIVLYSSFSEFVAELNARLGAGKPVVALAAYGSYDESSTTLAANRIVVHFAPGN